MVVQSGKSIFLWTSPWYVFNPQWSFLNTCIYKQLSKDSVGCTVPTVRSKGNSPYPKSNRKKEKWLWCSCWPPGSQNHRSLLYISNSSILTLLSSTLNFPSAGASSHPQLLILISLLLQLSYLCPPFLLLHLSLYLCSCVSGHVQSTTFSVLDSSRSLSGCSLSSVE